MVSLMQWTQTWANSGRWLEAGKPGVLQSMGSRRVQRDLVGDWTTTTKERSSSLIKKQRDACTMDFSPSSCYGHCCLRIWCTRLQLEAMKNRNTTWRSQHRVLTGMWQLCLTLFLLYKKVTPQLLSYLQLKFSDLMLERSTLKADWF